MRLDTSIGCSDCSSNRIITNGEGGDKDEDENEDKNEDGGIINKGEDGSMAYSRTLVTLCPVNAVQMVWMRAPDNTRKHGRGCVHRPSGVSV